MPDEKINFTIRRAEPEDYKSMHQIFAGPKAFRGTLQLPFPSAELWRKRLAEPPEGTFNLLACVNAEIVGPLGLPPFPTHPRRRRRGPLGMAGGGDGHG